MKIDLNALLASALMVVAPVASAQDTTIDEARVDDVVVTARRSGAPMWRISAGGRSLILVGVIEEVSKDTRWSPASLETALIGVDRLLFPDAQDVSTSPFAIIGFALKWKHYSVLPADRSLTQLLTRAQYARLEALRRRGLLPSKFERRHPWLLALDLREHAKGRGFGPDPSAVVRKIAKRRRIAIIPLTKLKGKPVLNALFQSRPEQHVPCLMAAVALAEAGPTAVRERSDAWASGRIAASLHSVAEGVHSVCFPAGSRYDITP